MEKMDPEKRIEVRLQKMTETLNLTAAQQKDVRKLMEDNQKSQLAKQEEHKKMQEKRRMDMQNQRKMYDYKMSAILNADQNAKWQKMQVDKKEKMREKVEKRQRKESKRENKK